MGVIFGIVLTLGGGLIPSKGMDGHKWIFRGQEVLIGDVKLADSVITTTMQ